MLTKINGVFLGAAGVGKSKILKRLNASEDFYSEKYDQTIGAQYGTIRFSKTEALGIWDVAGAERYRSLLGMYTRNAVIYCLMWDPLGEFPLNFIEEFITNHKEDIENKPLIFVRCKADIPVSESILKAQIQSIKTLMGAEPTIIATSAKTEAGIDQLKTKMHELVFTTQPNYQNKSNSTPTKSVSNKKSPCCCGWFSKRKSPSDQDNLLQTFDSTDADQNTLL